METYLDLHLGQREEEAFLHPCFCFRFMKEFKTFIEFHECTVEFLAGRTDLLGNNNYFMLSMYSPQSILYLLS